MAPNKSIARIEIVGQADCRYSVHKCTALFFPRPRRVLLGSTTGLPIPVHAVEGLAAVPRLFEPCAILSAKDLEEYAGRRATGEKNGGRRTVLLVVAMWTSGMEVGKDRDGGHELSLVVPPLSCTIDTL